MHGRTPKVNQPEAFSCRVQFAAAVIARRGPCTRAFDSCCEMHDGAAVSAALVRRAKARPNGKLARNLFDYINRERAESSYEATKHLNTRGLVAYAAELRAQAEREFKEYWNAEYAAGRVSGPYHETAA